MGSACLWAVVAAFAVGASIPAAASEWLSQHNCSAASPLLVPGIIASVPYPALRCWPKLARQALVQTLCIAATCVGFPQPPKLTLWVAELCALDSVPKVHPLCALVSAPGLASAWRGQWELASAPMPTLGITGFMCTCSSHCLHSLSWHYFLLCWLFSIFK